MKGLRDEQARIMQIRHHPLAQMFPFQPNRPTRVLPAQLPLEVPPPPMPIQGLRGIKPIDSPGKVEEKAEQQQSNRW
jgi:hypothetical protein